MKIPEDKLPFSLGNQLKFGHYGIRCKDPKHDALYKTKFIGYAVTKDLSQYVVDASNKFPEAIELLKELQSESEEADFKVQEFLKSLEDEYIK